ncbi:MAG: polysaccharide lyase 6 family protein [Halieaceae bacterium]|nr:polysaccharide lyase 6 family protein [Halieaceae bacterium]
MAVSQTAPAAEIMVRSEQEFLLATKGLQPGDSVILANGQWRDFEMVFSGRGRPGQPITLRAETPGKVLIGGKSNLRLAGEYLLVTGLVFRDGHTPTNEVISFRRGRDQLANHSRVTNIVIDHYNNPERYERDFWVMMYGKNNRFDHNHLEGKSNAGVTMAVRLDSQGSRNNRHRIDHNYFGPRPILGANGGETLRIGTSKYSLTESETLVENNYFDRCNGELEIISNKSGKNVFRGNVFLESRGTLTLRHGNDNLVEANVFLGNGVEHTGGIRVINKRQVIRNNYLSGLTGHRFGGALVIMNGVPDSPINRYHQVEDSLIENNSLIDNEHIEFAAGSDEERSAVPIRSTFRNNLIVNSSRPNLITVHDEIKGVSFANNVVAGDVTLPDALGFERRQVALEKNENGLFHPLDESLAKIGAPRSLKLLERAQTGVSWYPKPGSASSFDSGATWLVDPGRDTLTGAFEKAAYGDIIELRPGDYTVTRILSLDRPLTVRAAANAQPRPRIQFERSALFELAEGGSLKLAGIAIDGSLAPDASGNSVVRTSRYSMLSNYELEVANAEVLNLDTNHSFNFLRVSSHTFAQKVSIRGSLFRNISGHVIALDREIDDLGIYNGEYITLTGSTFENIGGAVISIYRGGTDESTFGPHVRLQDSILKTVGKNRRNRNSSAVFLHGVQQAEIRANLFSDSQPLRIVETVGEPITVIRENQWVATPPPSVTTGGVR